MSVIAVGMALLVGCMTEQGAPSAEQEVVSEEGTVLEPTGKWITDDAEVLTPAQEETLSSMLRTYSDNTSTQVVGVTVSSLNGMEVNEYSRALANKWGIGQQGINNGILVLLAPNDRSVRIDIGYGIEWHISDQAAATIIDDMIPLLRDGEYNQAFETSFERLFALLEGVSWDIKYDALKDAINAGEEAEGGIVTFTGTLESIHNNTVQVKSRDGVEGQFNLLPRMKVDIEQKKRYTFYARLITTSPPVMNLVGYE